MIRVSAIGADKCRDTGVAAVPNSGGHVKPWRGAPNAVCGVELVQLLAAALDLHARRAHAKMALVLKEVQVRVSWTG